MTQQELAQKAGLSQSQLSIALKRIDNGIEKCLPKSIQKTL